jgi:hypothetical protein
MSDAELGALLNATRKESPRGLLASEINFQFLEFIFDDGQGRQWGVRVTGAAGYVNPAEPGLDFLCEDGEQRRARFPEYRSLDSLTPHDIAMEWSKAAVTIKPEPS